VPDDLFGFSLSPLSLLFWSSFSFCLGGGPLRIPFWPPVPVEHGLFSFFFFVVPEGVEALCFNLFSPVCAPFLQWDRLWFPFFGRSFFWSPIQRPITHPRSQEFGWFGRGTDTFFRFYVFFILALGWDRLPFPHSPAGVCFPLASEENVPHPLHLFPPHAKTLLPFGRPPPPPKILLFFFPLKVI